ncbi:MAG: DUF4388 domain-containing protein [Chloroflexi bacterium]|nr:DUF4388 domain-containing protein [Chloroflexota bacterium]
MPLQGSLVEMSLANLIQVNCQEMRSARLQLTYDGRNGEVYFSDGQVVHAVLDDKIGIEAVFEMLAWDNGAFMLDRDAPSPGKTISLNWNELLLQGMMRVPEKTASKAEAEKNKTQATLKQLRAIEGVTGAVISASDGIVLGADIPGSDGEQEAAVAVFVGSAAEQMGETLQMGLLSHGVVTLKDKRLLVLQLPDRFVGLVLSGERTSPAIVTTAAKETLRK